MEKKMKEEEVDFIRSIPYFKPFPAKLAYKMTMALEKVICEKTG
jgi:hypothetical protein